MSRPLLCVAHAHCDDGFGAAWAVRHALLDSENQLFKKESVEFYFATHGGKVPDVAGRDVVFVDFCYPRPVMECLIADAEFVRVLDHHKSSMLEWKDMFATVQAGLRDDIKETGCTKTPEGFERAWWRTAKASFEFDMNRSGARMAWDHYHPDQPAPRFIDYIQDHDLWTKKLSGVDEFTAALRSWPMDFEVWDRLFIPTPADVEAWDGSIKDLEHMKVQGLITVGRDILRYKRQLVDSAVKNSFWVEIDVPTGPALVVAGQPHAYPPTETIRLRGANVMPAIVSEVGEELALRYGGQSLTWVEGVKLWNYQLRSRPVGDQAAPDVSKIAVAFGGGGHHQAAGFKKEHAVHRKWVAPHPDEDHGD